MLKMSFFVCNHNIAKVDQLIRDRAMDNSWPNPSFLWGDWVSSRGKPKEDYKQIQVTLKSRLEKYRKNEEFWASRPEEQSEQEPASWVLCRLAVSGPFVVLFGIPVQTAYRPHKARRHKVTGGSRCVCVCVSLFQQDMFIHLRLVPHTTALRAFTRQTPRKHLFQLRSRFKTHLRWSQQSRPTAGIQDGNWKQNCP